MTVTLPKNALCQFEDCERPATSLVYGRMLRKVLRLCEPRAERILDEDSPEYHHTCENCGCQLPIN